MTSSPLIDHRNQGINDERRDFAYIYKKKNQGNKLLLKNNGRLINNKPLPFCKFHFYEKHVVFFVKVLRAAFYRAGMTFNFVQ